ncbi:hypothetical protein BJV78DRAFT_1151536 [Lactifluus subvellereus]|nr:hypothetical protein BJV78DRAFT_1151536 [Lactifluus subvellereus]
MSRLAILAPLFLSSIVVAHIYAPDCSLTLQWTFNSLGQDPCQVAAYLLATCSGGSFSLAPLYLGPSYPGPSVIDDGDLCLCNTVTYSLLTGRWTTWPRYSSNCTKFMPVSSTYTNSTPQLENKWNDTRSLAVGDSPELTPGMVISPSNASSTSPTPTPTPTTPSPTPTTPSPTPTHSSSSVALQQSPLLLRRKRPQGPSAAFVVDGAPRPLMGEVRLPGSNDGTYVPSSMPGTLASPMMLYDPNDPTTFPGFQGAGQPRIWQDSIYRFLSSLSIVFSAARFSVGSQSRLWMMVNWFPIFT